MRTQKKRKRKRASHVSRTFLPLAKLTLTNLEPPILKTMKITVLFYLFYDLMRFNKSEIIVRG
jgi:hypothetical protein